MAALILQQDGKVTSSTLSSKALHFSSPVLDMSEHMFLVPSHLLATLNSTSTFAEYHANLLCLHLHCYSFLFKDQQKRLVIKILSIGDNCTKTIRKLQQEWKEASLLEYNFVIITDNFIYSIHILCNISADKKTMKFCE